MDKCPYCGAETRQGDNFCLNCGNRLQPSTPSSQAAPVSSDATLAADDWAASSVPQAQHAPWQDAELATIAETSAEPPTMRAEASPAVAQAVMNRIDTPAHLKLRGENGETLQEYTLDKPEMTIGRAPNSDILLSKDKLISRRHATILYQNGQYSIRDERSANGTFVNSQQLEEMTPRELHDGDHIGIGEHELVFQSNTAVGPDIESYPTISVGSPPVASEMTYRTREDELLTAVSNDEYGTRSMNGGGTPQAAPEESAEAQPAPASPAPVPASPAPVNDVAPAALSSTASAGKSASSDSWSAAAPSSSFDSSAGVTFSRLTNLPQPGLPDIAPLMAALATLDGQVASLQEQLNATQEAIRNHDSDIAQTTSQLRLGVRSVSDRMDKTIADVARSREQLAWADLLQLMEDVMNNPRDIEYVTKLARKARELNKVFQIHQNVLNTLAECTSLLRSLLGDER